MTSGPWSNVSPNEEVTLRSDSQLLSPPPHPRLKGILRVAVLGLLGSRIPMSFAELRGLCWTTSKLKIRGCSSLRGLKVLRSLTWNPFYVSTVVDRFSRHRFSRNPNLVENFALNNHFYSIKIQYGRNFNIVLIFCCSPYYLRCTWRNVALRLPIEGCCSQFV